MHNSWRTASVRWYWETETLFIRSWIGETINRPNCAWLGEFGFFLWAKTTEKYWYKMLIKRYLIWGQVIVWRSRFQMLSHEALYLENERKQEIHRSSDRWREHGSLINECEHWTIAKMEVNGRMHFGLWTQVKANLNEKRVWKGQN